MAAWRKTARGRLKFELAGLAFALKHGFSHKDYAQHLWESGAARWMKHDSPRPGDYLQKEAAAFRDLCPDVDFTAVWADDENAELVFSRGCLGGFGQRRWAIAESCGLTKSDVCGYCRESFRVWAEQLGLKVEMDPHEDDTCRMRVTRD